MTLIAEYYEILYQLEISNFRLKIFNDKNANVAEFESEQKNNESLNFKIEELKGSLESSNENCDSIRSAFIHILHSAIHNLKIISGYNGYYPDLNQSMVIPGYLFGMILHDLKTALTAEGNYRPILNIYMSKKTWDSNILLDFLISLNTQLHDEAFKNKMEAIQHFENIRAQFLNLIESLKEQNII